MTKPKKIKPLDGFSNVADADVVSRCTNIQTSMTGNPYFPNPVEVRGFGYLQNRLHCVGYFSRFQRSSAARFSGRSVVHNLALLSDAEARRWRSIQPNPRP